MLAAIDIHKAVFQTAVLDPGDGGITEERFEASRTPRHDTLLAAATRVNPRAAPERLPRRSRETSRWSRSAHFAAPATARALEALESGAIVEMLVSAGA